MCFQGVKWLGVKEILRRIGSTIRSWKILCMDYQIESAVSDKFPCIAILVCTHCLSINGFAKNQSTEIYSCVSRQQEPSDLFSRFVQLQDGNKILNALRWVRSGFFVRASILPIGQDQSRSFLCAKQQPNFDISLFIESEFL
jgi:hypothetical protein